MLWSNNIHPQHEGKKSNSYRRLGRTMTHLKEIKTERPYTLSGSETTDLALFVRTSSEDVSSWNRQKIVDALVRETYIDVDTADKTSADVEEMILNSKIRVITAPLI